MQDPQNPAKLYNHDNQYLHYEDDWYIVKSVPDECAPHTALVATHRVPLQDEATVPF